MKNKWYYVTLGALLIALLGVGYWGYQEKNEKNQILLRQENALQQAFYELVSDLQQVEVTTSKAMVASTPGHNRELLANIWRQASSAQQNLAKLPLTREPLVNTQKFLNQIGDFSFTKLKEEDYDYQKQINTIHKRAKVLTTELQKLEAALAGKKYPWARMAAREEKNFSSATKALPTRTFSKIEDQMSNYPQLVYDGPFADENLVRTPRKLEGSEITKSQARNKAQDFLNVKGQQVQFSVRDIEEQIQDLAEDLDPDSRGRLMKQLKNGSPPLETYLVTAREKGQNGKETYVGLTKKGGKVLWMAKPRQIGEEKLSLQEAQRKAEEFLQREGMEGFKSTGVLRAFKQAVVSFAKVENGVIIYPDLVKVKVALDNGEIIGYEAANYIFAHHDRKLDDSRLSMEEAQKKLNPNFKVKKKRKAVIPLGTDKEVLTYEFYGSMNDMNFLIYINADTGKEEKILRVVESDNGVLTI